MGYTVIVTEKVSVASEYIKVLQLSSNGKTDGYVEGRSQRDGKDYIVTWCRGHLVTLSYPEVYDEKYKKWTMDDLPFIPQQYKYEVISDVKKQFGIIKNIYLSPRISEILFAGDAGREGIYIQMLVRQMAGHRNGVVEKVVWLNSQTESEIVRGIRDAKPLSEYANLTNAAYMRAIEDYCMGINFSRALTCKYGKQFNSMVKSEKWKTISVGRVMTCVLGMVVDRENEIRNFKETLFYKIEASCRDQTFEFAAGWKAVQTSKFYQSPLLYNDTGFLNKSDADQLTGMLSADKSLKVLNISRKDEKKNAPLLFNLAELQNECSKRFKINPDKTLDIAQKLYEAKLTTYPRTDARVLTTAVAQVLGGTFKSLYKHGYKTDCIKKIGVNSWHKGIEKTKYVNDKLVTDHYAIIPTGEGSESGLSDLEISVYHMIIDRFLSIFFPPAVYEKTDIELIHSNGEKFYAGTKTLKELGYLEVIGSESDGDDAGTPLPATFSLKKGDVIPAAYSVKEGKTQPPKRYNSGSMILAMENAGSLIEDEELREQIKSCGIGTSATRAGIIKKLVSVGYICLNDKTQIITPHVDGEAIYAIVKENLPDFLSPKMTASWEKGLGGIQDGKVTREQYNTILNTYVQKHIDQIKQKNNGEAYEEQPFASKTIGKCPACGAPLNTTKFGVVCSGKCGMSFRYYGKAFTPAQVTALNSGSKVTMSGKKKNGEKCKFSLQVAGIQNYSYKGKDGTEKSGKQWTFNTKYINSGKKTEEVS